MHTLFMVVRRRLVAAPQISSFAWILFALWLFPQVSLAQEDCTAFEVELEEYFLAHQPNDRLNISRIESVYKKCPLPTDKMSLIYFYFQAKHIINSFPNRYADFRTYDEASAFYDQSAKHFSYLINADPTEDAFVETYFAKAYQIERWLQRQARNLRQPRENRFYGDMDGEDIWVKSKDQSKKRGEEDIFEFERKFLQDGRYIDELPPYYETSAGWEAFGYVGSVEDLSFMEYLDWQRADRTRGQEVSGTELFALDPSAWIATLNATPGSYIPLMSIEDNLVIFQRPVQNSGVITEAKFGEVLAQITREMPVISQEITYLPVLTERGQTGWIDKNSIAERGRLAVCIAHTSAYQQLNARADRNAVIFAAGELIVLEGARDNWIRAVGRNGVKRGWISGTDILSIDPTDLFIGSLMYRALKSPTTSERIERLEEIRNVAGYTESSLSPYVERLINLGRS